MNKNELRNSIKLNLDQAVADFGKYTKLMGSGEGNLAMLYSLEDVRRRILLQFALDDDTANDPLIGKGNE